MRRQMNLVRYW